jgi:hypothetical protein
MRGRGAALLIGMKAGENKANQQAAAQQQAAASQQAAAEQAAAQQKAADEAKMAAAAPADPTAELKKLADLHAAGILTDEEFAAAKKKALGI